MTNGGVVERGDAFYIEEKYIGSVVGFDVCHYPNHYNIIIETDKLLTAANLKLCPSCAAQIKEKVTEMNR